MKNFFLITCLLCSITIFGQEENNTSQNKDVIEIFIKLSTQQLYDTANYYLNKNSYDTALIYYNFIIKTIPSNADFIQQKILSKTYNRLAYIYVNLSDYRMAYDYFIKQLLICEKFNLVEDESIVYGNIGVIYGMLKQYDIAKQYYLKSLDLGKDTLNSMLVLNNLSVCEMLSGIYDNALFYLNKAISISNQNNGINLQSMLNNLGSYYQNKKQYDSAFYYFNLSLDYSKDNNDIKVETESLSNIGNLYFELNKTDSALYYIDLANKKAYENKFISVLAENFLTLSEIEKSKGRFENALKHYVNYTNLKDSIYNSEVFGSINFIQRQYEISKTDQQIEELVIDRQIKENTIHYQKIILRIIISVSVLMGFVLLFIIVQNKKLKKAYNKLVDKNIEILELQKGKGKETLNPKLVSTPENTNEKYKNKILSEKNQKELLSKILSFMENTSIICNPDFSMNILIESVQSKHVYVSYVLNHVIKKSFSSFLNSYRIREAQRLFSRQDTSKYTVESVANLIGYKSRNSFNEAFKEITGVTPGFYIKSLHGKQKEEK